MSRYILELSLKEQPFMIGEFSEEDEAIASLEAFKDIYGKDLSYTFEQA